MQDNLRDSRGNGTKRNSAPLEQYSDNKNTEESMTPVQINKMTSFKLPTSSISIDSLQPARGQAPPSMVAAATIVMSLMVV